MKVEETEIPGVLRIQAPTFHDSRGSFRELWRADRYQTLGLPTRFAQDNISLSRRGVLRGLHLQEPHPQGKLVSVVGGEVWDVAVDVRLGSPTFGRWVGCTLSAETGWQLWIPAGFAHGFVVTSEDALVVYKCTEVYHPQGEATVRWDDPDLAIDWPVRDPVISEKDRIGVTLREMAPSCLPRYPEAS